MMLPSRLVTASGSAAVWAGPAFSWELALAILGILLVAPVTRPRRAVPLTGALVAGLAAATFLPAPLGGVLRAGALVLWASLALPEGEEEPAERVAWPAAALWLLAGFSWFASARLLLDMAANPQVVLCGLAASWALSWAVGLWGTTSSSREHRVLAAAPLAGALLAERLLAIAGAVPEIPDLAGRLLMLVPAGLSLAALFVVWSRPQPEAASVAPQEEHPARPESPLASLDGFLALSSQEALVLERSFDGQTLRIIAQELGVAPSTVGTYRSRALQKLGVSSQQELAELVRAHATRELRADDNLEPAATVAHPSQRAALVLAGVSCGLSLAVLCACPVAYRAACAAASLGCFVASYAVLIRSVRLRHEAWAPFLFACGLMTFALVPPGATLVGMARAPLPLVAATLALLLVACLLAHKTRADHVRVAANAVAHGEKRVASYLEGRGIGKVQADVVLLTANGLSAKSIAEVLYLAPSTVSNYRTKAYAALGVHNKQELCDLLEREAGFERPFSSGGKQ